MRPEDVLREYEARINLHDFSQLAPLISDTAIFWFNDGSHAGIGEVRSAFEATWRSFPLERYWLEDVKWIALGDGAAGCAYYFRWEATVNGKRPSGGGRGTTVIRTEGGQWKIVHEHLSQFPS
jgi:ketosteroid isomerase-like protein